MCGGAVFTPPSDRQNMRRTAHLSACEPLCHVLRMALTPRHDDTARVLVVVRQDGEIAAHTVLVLELNIERDWEK